jgi:hypothetical protein
VSIWFNDSAVTADDIIERSIPSPSGARTKIQVHTCLGHLANRFETEEAVRSDVDIAANVENLRELSTSRSEDHV